MFVSQLHSLPHQRLGLVGEGELEDIVNSEPRLLVKRDLLFRKVGALQLEEPGILLLELVEVGLHLRLEVEDELETELLAEAEHAGEDARVPEAEVVEEFAVDELVAVGTDGYNLPLDVRFKLDFVVVLEHLGPDLPLEVLHFPVVLLEFALEDLLEVGGELGGLLGVEGGGFVEGLQQTCALQLLQHLHFALVVQHLAALRAQLLQRLLCVFNRGQFFSIWQFEIRNLILTSFPFRQDNFMGRRGQTNFLLHVIYLFRTQYVVLRAKSVFPTRLHRRELLLLLLV